MTQVSNRHRWNLTYLSFKGGEQLRTTVSDVCCCGKARSLILLNVNFFYRHCEEILFITLVQDHHLRLIDS